MNFLVLISNYYSETLALEFTCIITISKYVAQSTTALLPATYIDIVGSL